MAPVTELGSVVMTGVEVVLGAEELLLPAAEEPPHPVRAGNPPKPRTWAVLQGALRIAMTPPCCKCDPTPGPFLIRSARGNRMKAYHRLVPAMADGGSSEWLKNPGEWGS